jgi:hypothetical protein
MGKSFTRADLEARTSKDLKRMCIDELGITGVSKKPKEVVIKAILNQYGAKSAGVAPAAGSGPVTGLEFTGQSIMTKPSGQFGHRTTTTIHVSCGASSGNFPVVGRTVKQVGEFLREVLNVDRLSTGLINGKEVNGDYVLKEGDNLEFLKPAGKKGC